MSKRRLPEDAATPTASAKKQAVGSATPRAAAVAATPTRHSSRFKAPMPDEVRHHPDAPLHEVDYNPYMLSSKQRCAVLRYHGVEVPRGASERHEIELFFGQGVIERAKREYRELLARHGLPVDETPPPPPAATTFTTVRTVDETPAKPPRTPLADASPASSASSTPGSATSTTTSTTTSTAGAGAAAGAGGDGYGASHLLSTPQPMSATWAAPPVSMAHATPLFSAAGGNAARAAAPTTVGATATTPSVAAAGADIRYSSAVMSSLQQHQGEHEHAQQLQQRLGPGAGSAAAPGISLYPALESPPRPSDTAQAYLSQLHHEAHGPDFEHEHESFIPDSASLRTPVISTPYAGYGGGSMAATPVITPALGAFGGTGAATSATGQSSFSTPSTYSTFYTTASAATYGQPPPSAPHTPAAPYTPAAAPSSGRTQWPSDIVSPQQLSEVRALRRPSDWKSRWRLCNGVLQYLLLIGLTCALMAWMPATPFTKLLIRAAPYCPTLKVNDPSTVSKQTCIPCPPNAICAHRSYHFRCAEGFVPRNDMCIRPGEVNELAHTIGNYQFLSLLQQRRGEHECYANATAFVSERELRTMVDEVVSDLERRTSTGEAQRSKPPPSPQQHHQTVQHVVHAIIGMVERKELAATMHRLNNGSYAFVTTAAPVHPYSCALANVIHDNAWLLAVLVGVALWESFRQWREFLARQEADLVDQAVRKVYRLLQDSSKGVPKTQSRDYVLDACSFSLDERKRLWEKVMYAIRCDATIQERSFTVDGVLRKCWVRSTSTVGE